MASRDSLSMLVTLELRERVNELSLASGRQGRSGKNRRREPNTDDSALRLRRLQLMTVNGEKNKAVRSRSSC